MRLFLLATVLFSAVAYSQSHRHEDGSIECAPGWTPRGAGCALTADNLERGQSDEARNWCPRGSSRSGSGCSFGGEADRRGPQAERRDPRSDRRDPREEREDQDDWVDGEENIDWVEACAGSSYTRPRLHVGSSYNDPCNSRTRRP